MDNNKISEELISGVVESLSNISTSTDVYHQGHDKIPFPSSAVLREIVDMAREVLFPGYFGSAVINQSTIKYYIGVLVDRLSQLLFDQVLAGLCFSECKDSADLMEKQKQARCITEEFISYLPELRDVLLTDVIASFDSDPAAKSNAEIVLAYPTMKAVSSQRMAHKLWVLGVPFIPRMITEMAHSETGIDIHPGAQIGNYFSIDHGTGVVIGETAIIGNNVKLYQGVTLGAKKFPLDENGKPIKDAPRHPIVKDNVTIYSHAAVLGRITIGEGATIGANKWVLHDVPDGMFVKEDMM